MRVFLAIYAFIYLFLVALPAAIIAGAFTIVYLLVKHFLLKVKSLLFKTSQ